MAGKTKLDIVKEGLVAYFDVANPRSIISFNDRTGFIGIRNIARNVGKKYRSEFLANDSFKTYPTYVNENGGVYDFNGTTDGLSIVPIESYQYGTNEGLTFGFWLKINVVPSIDAYQIIYTKADNWGAQIIADGSANYRIFTYYNSLGVTYEAISDTKLKIGLWYNIVFTTKDGVSPYGLYINGIPETGVFIDNEYIIPLYIGTSIGANYFKGKMSNILFYEKTLNESEVLQNYNALKYRF